MELGVIEVLSCLAVNGTLTFFFSAIVSSYFANELASFIADFTFNEYKHNVSFLITKILLHYSENTDKNVF